MLSRQAFRSFNITLLISAHLTMAGCRDPIIDASSMAALDASHQAIKATLDTPAERLAYERAYQEVIIYTGLISTKDQPITISTVSARVKEDSVRLILAELDEAIGGMSADELIEYAEHVAPESARLTEEMIDDSLYSIFGPEGIPGS